MKRICLVVFLLFYIQVFSQNTFIEEFYTTGNAQNIFGKPTSDSGYLLYGFNLFQGGNGLTKTDSSGIVEFSKYYTFPPNFRALDAIENQTGYMLFGVDNSSTSSIIKIDSNGNYISGTSYYTTQASVLYFLGKIGTDIYLNGFVNNHPAIIKMDSSGTVLWTKEYVGDSSNLFGVGTINSNNELCFTGFYRDSLFSYYKSVSKLDSSGNFIWNKKIDLLGNFNIAKTEGSGFIISSYTGHVIKFDSLGTIEWSKYYYTDPTNYLEVKNIKKAKDQGYIIGGIQNTNISQPGFLLHVDELGVVDWAKNYSSAVFNSLYVQSCDVASDSGYIVVGTCGGFTSTLSAPTGFMIKTDNSGNLGCFDSTVFVIDSSISVNISPITFSMTIVNSFLNDSAFFPNPIESNEPTNFICPPSTNIEQNKFNQFYLYPNPIYDKVKLFNSDMRINLFTVYNTFGKKVLETMLMANETEFSFSHLPNGIYFYQLNNSENNFTGKFIVAH